MFGYIFLILIASVCCLIKLFIYLNKKKPLPPNILYYITKNAPLRVQLKLFKCSKQMRNRLRRIRGFQIDYLYVYASRKKESIYIKEEDFIHVSLKERSLLKLKQKLLITESLFLDSLKRPSSVLLQVDTSELKQLNIWSCKLGNKDFKRLHIPSLQKLVIDLKIKNPLRYNLLLKVLTHLPRLEHLQ